MTVQSFHIFVEEDIECCSRLKLGPGVTIYMGLGPKPGWTSLHTRCWKAVTLIAVHDFIGEKVLFLASESPYLNLHNNDALCS